MPTRCHRRNSAHKPAGIHRSSARRIGQIPPEFDAKSLRHFFASTAVRNGIPLSDVADYMGQKDMQVTHKTYKHLLPESLTSMSRMVSKALFQ